MSNLKRGLAVISFAAISYTSPTPDACADARQLEESPAPYALNRADEDYRYLRDTARHTDLWDPIKYVPLDGSGKVYLSFGGEARERFEYFDNFNWGSAPQDDGYFLQRYFLHGDLHLGEPVRLFAQFQSSLENGRKGGPRPTDRDEFDLHQAFLDLRFHLPNDATFTFRSGRQELAYATQRLISVREGPNVRQSFDGFRAMYRQGSVQLDGIAVRPVQTNRHVFDDDTDNGKGLWGAYGVFPFPALPQANLDLYYLGLYRGQARFDQGPGRETRHSAGTRLWRSAAPLDYNFEALYQWGTFDGGDIRAWTVASDTGYTLAKLPLRPRVGLRADIASGDQDPRNPDLQSFNPLFPKGAYFSEAGLIGPVNFIDLNPCVDLHLPGYGTLIFDWDFFWRESTHDGLYNNAVAVVRSGRTSNASYIGSMTQVQYQWEITRHLSVVGIYGHFFAGPFLRQTGPGEDVEYVTTWVSYKF